MNADVAPVYQDVSPTNNPFQQVQEGETIEVGPLSLILVTKEAVQALIEGNRDLESLVFYSRFDFREYEDTGYIMNRVYIRFDRESGNCYVESQPFNVGGENTSGVSRLVYNNRTSLSRNVFEDLGLYLENETYVESNSFDIDETGLQPIASESDIETDMSLGGLILESVDVNIILRILENSNPQAITIYGRVPYDGMDIVRKLDLIINSDGTISELTVDYNTSGLVRNMLVEQNPTITNYESASDAIREIMRDGAALYIEREAMDTYRVTMPQVFSSDPKPTESPVKDAVNSEFFVLNNESFTPVSRLVIRQILQAYNEGEMIFLIKNIENGEPIYTRYLIYIAPGAGGDVRITRLNSSGEEVGSIFVGRLSFTHTESDMLAYIDQSSSDAEFLVERNSVESLEIRTGEDFDLEPQENILIGNINTVYVDRLDLIRYIASNPGVAIEVYMPQSDGSGFLKRTYILHAGEDILTVNAVLIYENGIIQENTFSYRDIPFDDLDSFLPEAVPNREMYIDQEQLENIRVSLERELVSNVNPSPEEIPDLSLEELRLEPSYNFIMQYLNSYLNLNLDLSRVEVSYTTPDGRIERINASAFANIYDFQQAFIRNLNNENEVANFLRNLLSVQDQGTIISFSISILDKLPADPNLYRTNVNIRFNPTASRIEVVESHTSQGEDGRIAYLYTKVLQADGILQSINIFNLVDDLPEPGYNFASFDPDLIDIVSESLGINLMNYTHSSVNITPQEFRSDSNKVNFITQPASERSGVQVRAVAQEENLSRFQGSSLSTDNSAPPKALIQQGNIQEKKAGFVLPGAKLMYKDRVVVVERKTSDGKMVKVKYENPSPQDPVAFEVPEGDLEWIKRSQPKKSSNLFGRLGEFLRNAAPGR